MALAACYRILVASNATSITSLLFNPSGTSGATLNVTSETVVGTQPTWITGHPTNPSLAFTGLEQDDGKAIALTYDDTGNGTIAGEIPSGGAVATFLLATTDALFVANVRRVPLNSCARVARSLLTPLAWMMPLPKTTVRFRVVHGLPSVWLATLLPRLATTCSVAVQWFRP